MSIWWPCEEDRRECTYSDRHCPHTTWCEATYFDPSTRTWVGTKYTTAHPQLRFYGEMKSHFEWYTPLCEWRERVERERGREISDKVWRFLNGDKRRPGRLLREEGAAYTHINDSHEWWGRSCPPYEAWAVYRDDPRWYERYWDDVLIAAEQMEQTGEI